MIRVAGKPASPYKGLVPYGPEDSEYFVGRERDCEIIIANLRAARLTVLYGSGGVGKSSILQAGVVAQLRERAWQYREKYGKPRLVVAVINSWQGDPMQAILAGIRNAVAVSQALALSTNGGEDPLTTDMIASWQKDLSDSEKRPGEILVIMDQFEEYFLYHEQDDNDAKFARSFSELLMASDLCINFLISMREEDVSKLDRFKNSVPILNNNRLRLERLDAVAAATAITKPLETYNEGLDKSQQVTIETELVKAVVEAVKVGSVLLGDTGGGATSREGVVPRVEAPYLQLVMERLWRETPTDKRTLTLETFTRLGGAKQIVQDHLDNAMDIMTEGQKAAAAAVFYHLVTPSGTKIAQKLSDLRALTPAIRTQLSEEQCEQWDANLDAVLETLSDKKHHTVKPSDQKYRILVAGQGDDCTFEIFHDALAPAILDWRRRYVTEHEHEDALRRSMQEAERKSEEAKRRAVAAIRVRIALLGSIVTVGFLLVLVKYAMTLKQSNEQLQYTKFDLARNNELQAVTIARSTVLSRGLINFLTDVASDKNKLAKMFDTDELYSPTNLKPYRLDLAAVIGKAGVDQIISSGALVFQTTGFTGGGVGHGDSMQVASAMARQVNAADNTQSPSFLYLLGNIVFLPTKDLGNYYSQFYLPFINYPAPIFAIAGNHDGKAFDKGPSLQLFNSNFCASNPTPLAESYANELGPEVAELPVKYRSIKRTPMKQPNVYWTLECPFVTIIGVYTNVSSKGDIDKAQQDWLLDEVKRTSKGKLKDKFLILALHHSLYRKDKTRRSGIESDIPQILDNIFKQANRTPDLVLTGHARTYQSLRHLMGTGNPRIVNVGTGGVLPVKAVPVDVASKNEQRNRSAGTAKDAPADKFDDQHSGFLRLTVTAKSLVGDYFVLPKTGEFSTGDRPFDSFTIQPGK